MKLNQIGILMVLFAVQSANADISDAYRSSNAVVYYDFAETSNAVIDKGTYCPPPLNPSTSCQPINLTVVNPANTVRSANLLSITGANLIRSAVPAAKIYNACKTTGELTVDMTIANYETVIARSGMDAAKRPQPLRILSFSRDLTHRNFILGQFYDSGNMYQIGARTSSNENNTTKLGNSLSKPLMSSTTSILFPNPTHKNQIMDQKIVFTLNSTGVGRLYLSDLDGNLFLANEETVGFGNGTASSYFSNWFADAYLNLGNENLLTTATIADANGNVTSAALNEFVSKSSNGSNIAECGASCYNEPNRYWKGWVKKVAIYCNAVPMGEILGQGTINVMQNVTPSSPIDIALASMPDAAISKAQQIYVRLTGVKLPATDQRIKDMASLISANQMVAAAAIATNDAHFINTTVRDFAAKMSTRAETIDTPLNDFTATFMGFARDNLNAQQLLTADFFYMANTNPDINPATSNIDMSSARPVNGWPTAPVPARYVDDILKSNNHYESLDVGRYDLNAVLVRKPQKVLNARVSNPNGMEAVANPDPAGILTSRQWLKEHAFAGTNRRLVEFSLKEFLCTPIEMAADAGGADDVIGPDIDRLPGGDNSTFQTTCRACHTILDSFRPAFAEWSFGNGFPKHVSYTDDMSDDGDEDLVNGMKKDDLYPGVAFKYNKKADSDPKSAIYPDGRRTKSNEWTNHALTGSNKVNFQFNDSMTKGTGVKSFGQLISTSPKFQRCMAERAFKQICKRDATNNDSPYIQAAADAFMKSGFKLKALFQNIVIGNACIGEAN